VGTAKNRGIFVLREKKGRSSRGKKKGEKRKREKERGGGRRSKPQ